jgi:D-arabinose 5-phosphate isomerase GutQ
VSPWSTGTKSVFLNPTDALHGDIGIVGQAGKLS